MPHPNRDRLHVPPLDGWFNSDVYAAVAADPLKGVLAAQRIGNVKPSAPVYF